MATRAKVPCSYPGCPALVPGGTGGRCDQHRRNTKEYYQHYDKHVRDQDTADFYNSRAWRRVSSYKLKRSPLCEVCLMTTGRIVVATTVHHIVEVKENWDRRFDLTNCQSICHRCHQRIHGKSDGK